MATFTENKLHFGNPEFNAEQYAICVFHDKVIIQNSVPETLDPDDLVFLKIPREDIADIIDFLKKIQDGSI